jgi:four helix bundle protein
MIYNLEERTKEFSKSIVSLIKNTRLNIANSNICNQLIRSATSIGANYREANNGSSKKDFANKIYICRKECEETKYWIELLAEVESERKTLLRNLWQEAQELTKIFNTISNSCKSKKFE